MNMYIYYIWPLDFKEQQPTLANLSKNVDLLKCPGAEMYAGNGLAQK